MQSIKIYVDSETGTGIFCARWGLPFPEHLEAGFGPSPLSALMDLFQKMEARVATLETLDFEGEDETDRFALWLHNEENAAIGSLQSSAEIVEHIAGDVIRKCTEPNRAVFNSLGELQHHQVDVKAARVATLRDVRKTYEDFQKGGDPYNVGVPGNARPKPKRTRTVRGKGKDGNR